MIRAYAVSIPRSRPISFGHQHDINKINPNDILYLPISTQNQPKMQSRIVQGAQRTKGPLLPHTHRQDEPQNPQTDSVQGLKVP